jgi:catechol 2,3-dioxygenase-like lactoylglutathione lyase family enzyme
MGAAREEAAMSTFRKVTHIGVCVSDMERSKQFYCNVLGFRYVRELRVEGEPSDTLLRLRDVKVHAVYIERDGFELELLHYTSPRSPRPAPAHAMNDLGFTHLSIQVPNLEEAMAALEAAGVEVMRSTFIKMGGVGVAVFAKDPDGLLVELVLAQPEPAA